MTQGSTRMSFSKQPTGIYHLQLNHTAKYLTVYVLNTHTCVFGGIEMFYSLILLSKVT